MVELHCETDFVARTDAFRQGIWKIVDSIHENDNVKETKGKEQQTDKDLIDKIVKETKLVQPLESGSSQ